MTRSCCPRVSQGQGAVGTVIKDVGLHPSVLESDIRSFAQVVLVVLKIMSALAGFKNRFGHCTDFYYGNENMKTLKEWRMLTGFLHICTYFKIAIHKPCP
ncbi:hypothetical protein CDAR_514681 [Caerostris darwini]|uniref:Uncharacterized protein n=1 Tax=Caerostris darwini TaxID=1538125 RepID=A0AAV4QGL8_9ARAC|nr:hypothetical protein CDAR_514681 [Caerostris darwini]